MKKSILLALFLLGIMATSSLALYKGNDVSEYRGAYCIHFTVPVDSTTTAAVFSAASYAGKFTYVSDLEFTIKGSSPVYVGSTSNFVASTSTSCRKMDVGETFRTNGRNNASIYIKTLNGTTDTAIITGTIWGY